MPPQLGGAPSVGFARRVASDDSRQRSAHELDAARYVARICRLCSRCSSLVSPRLPVSNQLSPDATAIWSTRSTTRISISRWRERSSTAARGASGLDRRPLPRRHRDGRCSLRVLRVIGVSSLWTPLVLNVIAGIALLAGLDAAARRLLSDRSRTFVAARRGCLRHAHAGARTARDGDTRARGCHRLADRPRRPVERSQLKAGSSSNAPRLITISVLVGDCRGPSLREPLRRDGRRGAPPRSAPSDARGRRSRRRRRSGGGVRALLMGARRALAAGLRAPQSAASRSHVASRADAVLADKGLPALFAQPPFPSIPVRPARPARPGHVAATSPRGRIERLAAHCRGAPSCCRSIS